MKTRRQAREAVLQALYQSDALDDWSAETLQLFFNNFILSAEDREVKPEALEFYRRLLSTVLENREAVERYIGCACTNWSIERMVRIDRNILRLATAEIIFLKDIPVNVSINEAIEIAKRFGADESANFVNGVLDKVAFLHDQGQRTRVLPTRETVQREPLKVVRKASNS